MANIINTTLTIIGNQKAIDWANEKFDIEENNVEAFIKSFYENDPVTNQEDIPTKWLLNNVGAKWIYLEFQMDKTSWKIHSGNHFPMQFFKHLFKALLAYDPSVKMEITYADESYDPIGAALFVTDAKNNPKYCSLETTVEKEIPDQKQNPDDDPDFGEKLFFIQDDLLARCYKEINSNTV